MAEHRARILPSMLGPPSFTVPDLVRLVNCLTTMSVDEPSALGRVAMAILDIPGKGIYMTRELAQSVRPPHGGLVK